MTFQCGKFRHYRYSLKGPNLYENPILLASHPSRKLMRKSGRSWCPRGFQNLIWFNALVCKQMLAICGAAGTGGSTKMLDIIMLAIGLGFFALSVGYAMACDQL